MELVHHLFRGVLLYKLILVVDLTVGVQVRTLVGHLVGPCTMGRRKPPAASIPPKTI